MQRIVNGYAVKLSMEATMRRSLCLGLSLGLTFGLLLPLLGSAADASEWTRFRGPAGTGTVDGPPIPWDVSAAENLKWRTELPGKGVSSPIIHDDHVFVTAYTGYGIDPENPGKAEDLVRHLLAFDRATGEELWRFSIATQGDEDPYKGFITQHGYASSTPVTDGERVYTLFGKSGLFAVDMNGKKLWSRHLGSQSDRTLWGDSSSPILVGDVIVVNAGVLGRHVVGVDKRNGEILWSVQDDAFHSSWSTPAVYGEGDDAIVLTHFPFKIMGIHPKTGKVVWHAETPLDDATSPSILVQGDAAYLTGSRAGHAMAVKLGGEGDVSESHVLWKVSVNAGITTPVIVGDAMYWASGGIFMAHDIHTGERIYRERLPRHGAATGGFPNVDYSSPIAVGDKVVQFTRNGESYIIEAGKEFRLASHNAPFEGDSTAFSATPAVSDGELFMRSEGFLYSIVASAGETPEVEASEGDEAKPSETVEETEKTKTD